MYTFIHFRHPKPGSCQFLIPSLEIDDTIGIMAHGSQSSNIFKQETPNSLKTILEVSINGGTPKWMVYNGKIL